jgi:hypothetical protein
VLFGKRPEELPVFRGMFNLFVCFLELCLLCAEYRVVNNFVIILEDITVPDLDNFHILSYDSRLGAPEWKIVTYYTYC